MITVEHLTKRYGDFTAVNDLSFEIEDGHIYGFLGPNGAGKSTTMNIMTGCLSPTEGTVKIDGFDIFEQALQAKKLIGHLPEIPPLYLSETPEEYLRFVGEAKGIKGKELEAQVESVIEQTRIDDVRNRRISALSKGYKQRVGIAQALLGDPRVIILDEPTVGLDPIQIIEIRELIRQLGKTHTVILSSHILTEVQALCEKILIIAKGQLIAFDTPDHLEHQLLSHNEVTFTADAPSDAVAEILGSLPHITHTEILSDETEFTTAKVQTDCEDVYDFSRILFSAFAKSKYPLLEISVNKADLESIFLELTESAQDKPLRTDSGDFDADAVSDSTESEEDK